MVLKSVEKIRGGMRDALATGEKLAERLAMAEVNAAIQTRLTHILIPTAIVALLLAATEAAAAFIGDPETMRMAVTSILLAAGIYGTWALATGLIEILPLLAVWTATRVGPKRLARLLLYDFLLRQLRQTFTDEGGKTSIGGHITRYALKFSGQPSSWESLAYRLADQIAPRMVRHGIMQTLLVLAPTVAAWAYYRFEIFPEIIRAETGLGFWSAFAYPLAALADVIAGTELRSALLRG
jgi:hypothetical protein